MGASLTPTRYAVMHLATHHRTHARGGNKIQLIKHLQNTTVLAIGLLMSAGTVAAEGLSTTDERTIQTIATHLQRDSAKGIDFVVKSNEYCVNAGIGNGGHMTHFAVEPASTREDIIDFIHAQSLIDAGIDLDKLPRHSGKLGDMKPGQWYYVLAGQFEPHHGTKYPFLVMVRATELK